MLIESNQLVIDKNTNLTYESHHNRVEAIVSRWDGEDFVTLAKSNCFTYDSLGEVLSGVLYTAGYENSVEIIDGLGLYTYEEEE